MKTQSHDAGAGDLAIRSQRVITQDGERPGVIVVSGERITALLHHDAPTTAHRVIDAGSDAVMPALVDSHVHVNEPGNTAWEGFETATRAAAAGGIGTIIDMPLNSIPVTTTPDALEAKRSAAQRTAHVDYGFWGGVIPSNRTMIEPLWHAGVLGFKCFLCDSGLPSFPPVGESDLEASMVEIARLDGLMLVHAEHPARLASLRECADPRNYDAYLASRPVRAETDAIDLVARVAERTRCRVHIVHVSSGEGVARVQAARLRGARISCETCPHYLTFSADELADGATHFKCAPPIREAAQRERLWEHLEDGSIDLVATDHSPCPPDMKQLDSGSFAAAWGGISSLELLLPAVWTGADRRGIALPRIARWLCEEPARLAGLGHRKGRLAPGYDADIVIWSPDSKRIVRGGALHHRHALTPYEGLELDGVVKTTIVRGRIAYDDTSFGEPRGAHLMRDAS